MTDYAKMSIDHLTDYRNQWPAQQSEWTRAELALQKRRAVRDAFLDLAEELRDEGLSLMTDEILELDHWYPSDEPGSYWLWIGHHDAAQLARGDIAGYTPAEAAQ